MTQLVWLRADLRIHDNPALAAAQAAGGELIVVAGLATQTWQRHHRSPIQAQLVLNRLHHLATELAQLRIPLRRLVADTFDEQVEEVLSIAEQHQVQGIYANHQYEWDEQQRDQALIRKASVPVHLTHDQVAVAPATLKTGQGGFYSVFTPYKRRWLQFLENDPPTLAAEITAQANLPCAPSEWPFDDAIEARYPSDSRSIGDAVEAWASRVDSYDQTRDFPAQTGTSQFSHWLAIGALSAKEVLHSLMRHYPNVFRAEGGLGTYVSEICWRDFYRNLIVEVPRISRDQPFKLATRTLPWRNQIDEFERWKEGRTGIPIVDAAMRQLNETGWMHNRCRMIVAMFLTKNLFIDWRWGEDYFMSKLIDGDLASNNGGWQWSASTGTDSAPYFRIMNPVSQSQKFDPAGDYIRRWVPELAKLDAKRIHEPYAKGPIPGLNYPQPMVDLKATRQRAIDLFKAHAQETTI